MTMTYEVTSEETGSRLDKLLKQLEQDHSRQSIQKWIKEEYVYVNGKTVKPNYICQSEDILSWSIPVEKEQSVDAENIPLDIKYEDDYLLVINKPKGMLVHPTYHVKTQTLVNALKHHCDTLSDVSGEERPGIVHRLDQHTSGLLVVAKDNETHEALKHQFKEKTVTRIYEAITYGVLHHHQGVIQAPIGRNPKNRLQMTVITGGKEAETQFRVLERFQQYTHVECELKTGRTHQIRVHLKYIDHPVVGDELYTRKKSSLVKGQALFAKRLGFIHPHTNEAVQFDIEQPNYFKHLLEKLVLSN